MDNGNKTLGLIVIAGALLFALGVNALFWSDFSRRDRTADSVLAKVVDRGSYQTYVSARSRRRFGRRKVTVYELKLAWQRDGQRKQRVFRTSRTEYQASAIGREIPLYLHAPGDLNSARRDAPWPDWTGLFFLLCSCSLLGSIIGAYFFTKEDEEELGFRGGRVILDRSQFAGPKAVYNQDLIEIRKRGSNPH